MIYYITFIISIHLAIKGIYENRRGMWKLSALTLILLAGFRGLSVGTDIYTYQLRFFDIAKHSNSITSFISSIDSTEILYLAVTYISAKIGSISVLFFLNESIIVFCIYKALYKMRYSIRVEIALAIYEFVFYCIGFNTVRQAMAMAILLLMITNLFEKKYFVAILLTMLAIGFHSSAMIGFGFIFLYFISISRFSPIYKCCIVGIVAFMSYSIQNIIVRIVDLVPFLPQKYLNRNVLFVGYQNINALILLLMIAGFISVTFYRIKFQTVQMEEERIDSFQINASFLQIIMFLGIITCLLAPRAIVISRIVDYFSFFVIICIPMGLELLERNEIIYRYITYGFLCLYFWYIFILRGVNEVYPYSTIFD